MPIKKSAEKALRQSQRRRIRNLRRKEVMKSWLKKAKLLVSEKKIEEAKTTLPQVYKAIDKAVKSGIVKKNTANRKKTHIANLINKAGKEL